MLIGASVCAAPDKQNTQQHSPVQAGQGRTAIAGRKSVWWTIQSHDKEKVAIPLLVSLCQDRSHYHCDPDVVDTQHLQASEGMAAAKS